MSYKLHTCIQAIQACDGRFKQHLWTNCENYLYPVLYRLFQVDTPVAMLRNVSLH